jgi:hypothetical protein
MQTLTDNTDTSSVTPRPRLNASVGKYFFWSSVLSIISFITLIAFLAVTARTSGAAEVKIENQPLWFQVLLGVVTLPVFVNFFFGPSIYSIWKKKKSGGWIVILNLILLFLWGFPVLLLWIWALKGATKEERPIPPILPLGSAENHLRDRNETFVENQTLSELVR